MRLWGGGSAGVEGGVWLGAHWGRIGGVAVGVAVGVDECAWELLGPRWDRSPVYSQAGRSLGGNG